MTDIKTQTLELMAQGLEIEEILEKLNDADPEVDEDYIDLVYYDHLGLDLSSWAPKKKKITAPKKKKKKITAPKKKTTRKQCSCCEQWFEAKNSQKYCSVQCRSKAEKDRNRAAGKKYKPVERRTTTTECAVCGCSFEHDASQVSRKYCSEACREFANQKSTNADRFLIFDRDGCRCQYCGATPAEDEIKLVLDHIIPRSKGGYDTAGNLVTACERCNISKHDREISEETLMLIQSTVEQRNAAQGILPNRGIKGSHCRGQEPRVP